MESTKKNSILIMPITPKTVKSPRKELLRMPTINNSLLKDLKDMFDLFDKDRDGKITTREVKSLLISLGREPSQEEIDNLIKDTDKDDNGVIDVLEFTEYMQANYQMEDEKLDEIVSAFKLFDIDGEGKISLEEFKTILMNFGGEFKESDVEFIFNEIDLDHDGKLAYAEFVELWKYR